MKSNAVVITGGLLHTEHAKTAHGLIRGTDRFNIVGIVDDQNIGKDAGEILDGRKRNIPIFASLGDFAKQSGTQAAYVVVGVATKGGVIPESLRAVLRDALERGYNLVNGLHEYVSDIPDLAALAQQK